MGPPRRHSPPPTTSMPQTTSSSSFTPQPAPEQSGSQMSSQAPSLGMTPASRYNHNLKVLRRRDPSIISIFDQFSHVCVYHHDGKKWDKHGYEGSMFLFERDSYPPYGFYIMNRVGMEDYIQRIYPEEELVPSGSFLIIRSYPDFLNNRLTSIQASQRGHANDKFSDAYAIPNIEELDSKAKGRSTIVGLWMHTDDSRESMIEVMRKLHTYIKKNVPYPEEFRYGPGRPPPPHKLRAVPRKTAGSTTDTDSQTQHTQSDSENDQHSDAPSASNGDLSAVDRLFLKISGPQMTSQPAATNSLTGISLLNDIFASASSPPTPANSTKPKAKPPNNNTPSYQPSTILSPYPSAGMSGPQVLNPLVLATILTGSIPSRTPSAASTAVSHPSSREGDNEDDGESDSPGTILDEDSDHQQHHPQQHSGASMARMAGADLLSAFGFGGPLPGQKINGDVTPRPPLNGLQRTPSTIEATSSISTVRGATVNVPASNNLLSIPTTNVMSNQKPRVNRALVPFEPDSELWPYSRGSDDVCSPTTDDDDDIVELNFEETSVLSDPDAFKRALKQKRSAVSLRGSITNGSINGSVNGHGSLNGSHYVGGSPSSEEKGKGRNRRRTKKERDAKAQQEIEQSWDIPQPSPAASRGPASHIDILFGSARAQATPSPSLSHSPAPENSRPSERGFTPISSSAISAPEMKTPTMTARATLGQANGHTTVGHTLGVAKGKGVAVNGNGYAKANGYGAGGPLVPELVTESMITTIDEQAKPLGRVDKNEFMREVVMLIHTDKAFVDRLYQDYIARLA